MVRPQSLHNTSGQADRIGARRSGLKVLGRVLARPVLFSAGATVNQPHLGLVQPIVLDIQLKGPAVFPFILRHVRPHCLRERFWSASRDGSEDDGLHHKIVFWLAVVAEEVGCRVLGGNGV